MDIEHIINVAFKRALNDKDKTSKTKPAEFNQFRSQLWVKMLAQGFRENFKTEDQFRVFSKDYSFNKDFGLNELLFDITVCKINSLKSTNQNKTLSYIESTKWIVESEMAKNTREFMYDFNKLIIGEAENNLFVGPLSDGIIKFIPELSKAAKHCSGNLYLSLIPHPADWEKARLFPKIWIFNGQNFISYNINSPEIT